MTSTASAKFVVVTAILFGSLAVVGSILGDPAIGAPLWFSQLWRIVSMSEIGIFLGLLGACAIPIFKLKVDPEDQIIRPLAMLALSCTILSIFAFFQMVERWSLPVISWRIPLSLLAYAFGDWSLILLIKRLRRVIKRALKDKAVIRFTITDVSHPGPDIDLVRQGS